MPFILYRFGKFLALHLPLRFSYILARRTASWWSFVSKKDRYAVYANLKVLFPSYDDDKIREMSKEVFINFAKYLVDFFRFSKIDKGYIDKNVKIEGIQNLKDAMKEKKGVILVSAHLGNWELGAATISILGFRLAAVVLPHKDSQVNRFFVRQREMKGLEVIPIGGLKRCFSALMDNMLLALVGDRDYFDSGIVVDFFGKSTILPKGPAVFNRRYGSLLVPTFMIRNSDDTFTLRFCQPIKGEITKDEHQDLVKTTERIAGVLEKVVREYPTQWYVFRRFWERIGWEKVSP